jgi:hypothetical protein
LKEVKEKIQCKQCLNFLNRKQKKYCSQKCRLLSLQGRKLSPETIQKLRGRKLSKETIEKQNRAKQRDAIRIEGVFKCEKCEKEFSSNTSLRAHKSKCNESEDLKKETPCHICGKIFSNVRSANMHIGISHADPEKILERNRKLSEARSKHVFRPDSKAEVSFFESIKEVFSDAVRSFQINGVGHVYDVFIPSENTIIEFDGDFWHGNPKKFSLSPRMKKQHFIDIAYQNFACKSGFNFVRVWQSESESFLLDLKENKECLKLRLQK